MPNDFDLHENYGYNAPRPPESHGMSDLGTALGILKIAFLLFLGVCVIRFLTRGADDMLTFTSLLERLSSAPSISFDWLDVFNFSLSEMFPSGLKWLGSFFDFFVDCFRTGMFIGTAVVNIFPFLFYFIQWLFV